MQASPSQGASQNIRLCAAATVAKPRLIATPNGGYLSSLPPGDPHVSLPTLPVESADVTGVDPGKSFEPLLCVIEGGVFVDRATRSTSQLHDHDKCPEFHPLPYYPFLAEAQQWSRCVTPHRSGG